MLCKCVVFINQTPTGNVDRSARQEVEQRAVLVVVGYQPQLCPGAVVLVVGGDEAENVVVAQHDRLVDLDFAEPGTVHNCAISERILTTTNQPFISRAKDLDGHILATPTAAPHFAEATFADDLDQADLSSNGSLHQQRKSGTTSGHGHIHQVFDRLTGYVQQRVRRRYRAFGVRSVRAQTVLALVQRKRDHDQQ